MDLDQALVVDEYVIERDYMPGRYIARLAIRYERHQFAEALGVAMVFLRERFINVVRSGQTASINGDSVTIYFWASGRKPSLTEQFQESGHDPRRI